MGHCYIADAYTGDLIGLRLRTPCRSGEVIRRMINHAVDKRVDEIIEKFCPHSEWKTIASVYNPRGPLARTRNIDEYTLELLIFGFTMTPSGAPSAARSPPLATSAKSTYHCGCRRIRTDHA